MGCILNTGELSERKPAASHYKKAGVGKGHNTIHNQEIQSRKPRPTKNLDDHEGQTRRPRRENEETGVGRSEIARAGEALLAKPNVQSAIAAALAMNEDGSTGENQHNQSTDQTELPSSITHNTDASPLQRMQQKLLDQAQTRITTSLAASAPSQTNERQMDEDWGADAVTAGHGAVQAASIENADIECCVCLDARASNIFLPCGHVCICKKCKIPYENGTEKECPMCRKEFTMIARAFF